MSEELIELRNRFLIGIAIATVFCIPFLFFFINKFGYKPSKIFESLKNKESIVLLVTKDKCNECTNIENILKENAVNYMLLNKDRESKYNEILRKIDIPSSDITPPTVIYLEKGTLHSSLLKPNEVELIDFINLNELSSSK